MTTENNRTVILIDNKVYDVTKFAKFHPGGNKIIEEFNNCDTTDYFYALHSNAARKMLKNMQCTEVAPEDRITPSDYIQMSEKLEKAGLFKADYVVEAVQILHTLAFCFLATYYSHTYPLIAVFCLGIGTLLGGWIGHQCDHQRNNVMRDVNLVYATVIDGFSPQWWSWKHNRHHLSTNEMDYDGDIQLAPFIYLWNPKKAEDSWNRGIQHVYFSALYSILHLKWQLDSLLWAVERRNYKELIGLAVHWVWYMMMPWKVWLLGVLVSGTITGWVVTASHQSEHKIETKKDFFTGVTAKSKYQIHDYVAHQVVTTRNIDLSSWLLNYMCGGMQYQIEHHIFPRIPLYKLGEVKPIVQQYCAERGLEYREESLWEITKRNYKTVEGIAKAKI